MSVFSPFAQHLPEVLAFFAGLFIGIVLGLLVGLVAIKRQARRLEREVREAEEDCDDKKEQTHGIR